MSAKGFLGGLFGGKKGPDVDPAPKAVPAPELDAASKEMLRFAKATGGNIIKIDPEQLTMKTAFDGAQAKPGQDIASALMRQLTDDVEESFIKTLSHLCDVLEDSALLMTTPKGGRNDMSDLAICAGFEERTARMFFSNAVERGAAQAMGIKTVAIWQEPKTGSINIMTSPQDAKKLSNGVQNALPNRSEWTLIRDKGKALLQGRQVGRMDRVNRDFLAPDHCAPELEDAFSQPTMKMRFDSAGPSFMQDVMGAMKAMLRREKRKLAGGPSEQRALSPA